MNNFLFMHSGSGEGEKAFEAGAGLGFRGGGGRGGVHPTLTEESEEEVNSRPEDMQGKPSQHLPFSVTDHISVSCRGRRGSQGSEPYSPYDFSENQDVPESKCHFTHNAAPLFQTLHTFCLSRRTISFTAYL